MGIPMNSGFAVKAPVPLDERTVLTRQQMCEISDNTLPDVYYAVSSENGKLYIYNKDNESEPYAEGGYGKYREVKAGSNDDYEIVLTLPGFNDIEEGKKVVYAYTVEGEAEAFGDVYVGLSAGCAVCLSSRERFVGLDESLAAAMDLKLSGETARGYYGWLSAGAKTIWITATKNDYADIDALIDAVKADAALYVPGGDTYSVGFDTDPEGNDLREYGRVIHTTTP